MKSFVFLTGAALLLLTAVGCSSDSPFDGLTLEGEDAYYNHVEGDSEGYLGLYYGCVVEANTDFTMKEFEDTLLKYSVWCENSISSYDASSGWRSRWNGSPGALGFLMPTGYEFFEEGEFNEYDLEALYDPFTHEVTCTSVWGKRYEIDHENKAIVFTSDSVSHTCYVLAVDEGRIIWERRYPAYMRVTRRSLEPWSLSYISETPTEQ